MLIALNSDGIKVKADDGRKGQPYYCDICEKELILCRGKKVKPYFKHNKNCSCNDSWQYEDSEFRRLMLTRFPASMIEAVITSDKGVKHRADVLLKDGKSVLMFTSPPYYSEDDFSMINAFFIGCGLKVFWIIDCVIDYYNDNLCITDREKGKYKWASAPTFCRKIIPQTDKSVFLLLYLSGDNKTDHVDELIEKVIWAPLQTQGDYQAKYSYLVTDRTDWITLGEKTETRDLMLSAEQRLRIYLDKTKVKSFREIVIGEPNQGSIEAYTCPKFATWANIKKCTSCINGVAVYKYEKDCKPCSRIYCSYPEIINPMGKKVKHFGRNA